MQAGGYAREPLYRAMSNSSASPAATFQQLLAKSPPLIIQLISFCACGALAEGSLETCKNMQQQSHHH